MTSALLLLFWLASFLVVYPYLVYPFLLRLLAALSPARRATNVMSIMPKRVSMIISAFNEEAVIARKLENALGLDFPADCLEIIVASDASSDRTDQIVREVAANENRVRLVRQEERRGKSAALNKAVAVAGGEIVVFSDANAMYERDAIRRLLEGFVDANVGYVVGAALYYDAEGKPAGESEGLYWRLELFLKRLESEFHSVVGGDGAIYALRRHLFWELEDDEISDFVNPLQVVAAGYRGIFVPGARCYEKTGETFAKEFRRKRRIVNRSWRAVRRYGHRFSMRAHGRFAFMLLSHKVVRWFGLPLMGIAWIANTALLEEAHLYLWTWFTISASLVIAAFGAVLDRYGHSQPRLVSILYYFYLVNVAGLLGIWDEWRGVRHVTWDHVRKTGS